jgi:hypothetical protein
MKLRILFLTVVTAALFGTQVVSAQPPGGRFGRRGTPSDPVQRRLQMLTGFLGLSAGQQSSVQSILTDERNKLATFQTQFGPQLQVLRSNLTDAIRSNNSSSITAATAAIAPLEAQQRAIQAGAAAEVYALLSPDQQTKVGKGLELLLGGPRGPRGPGRLGPPPGAPQN